MDETTTTKTAAELCAALELEDVARGLLRDEHTPRGFVDALIEGGHLVDAIKVLAHALPKHAAVAWASSCVHPGVGEDSTEIERTCLAAAEAWGATPEEAQRRAAQEAAEKSEYDTPAAWAATAAAWSGGSLGPADLPPIPPDDHLCAHAVSGAVALAAARVPEEIVERQKAYLGQGLERLGPAHTTAAATGSTGGPS